MPVWSSASMPDCRILVSLIGNPLTVHATINETKAGIISDNDRQGIRRRDRGRADSRFRLSPAYPRSDTEDVFYVQR